MVSATRSGEWLLENCNTPQWVLNAALKFSISCIKHELPLQYLITQLFCWVVWCLMENSLHPINFKSVGSSFRSRMNRDASLSLKLITKRELNGFVDGKSHWSASTLKNISPCNHYLITQAMRSFSFSLDFFPCLPTSYHSLSLRNWIKSWKLLKSVMRPSLPLTRVVCSEMFWHRWIAITQRCKVIQRTLR